MPTRKIALSDAEVREAVRIWAFYYKAELIVTELTTFSFNPSTQTISAEVTIKSE